MNADLVEFVWHRAHSRCEYCGLPQENSLLPFEIDHIIAQKHGGRATAKNLALACYYCNSFKQQWGELDLPKPWRNFRLPPALDGRLRELLDLQDRDGKLLPRERQEAEALVELVDMFSLMKTRTKQKNP